MLHINLTCATGNSFEPYSYYRKFAVYKQFKLINMNAGNVIVKGLLIFGILGFAVFIILIVAGMVMTALGFECNCYKVFAWSLIGVGVLSGIIFWFGCCCRDPESNECKGIKGHKDVIKDQK